MFVDTSGGGGRRPVLRPLLSLGWRVFRVHFCARRRPRRDFIYFVCIGLLLRIRVVVCRLFLLLVIDTRTHAPGRALSHKLDGTARKGGREQSMAGVATATCLFVHIVLPWVGVVQSTDFPQQ